MVFNFFTVSKPVHDGDCEESLISVKNKRVAEIDASSVL